MKHFIQYVDLVPAMEDRKTIRLLEFDDLISSDNVSERSIRMMAPEEVCKVSVTELSRCHPQRTFAWGHQEADGRTWLHGYATDGVYKNGDGKVVPKRKMRVAYADGRDETIRPANDDPFEIDLSNETWSDAATMSFYVGGVEAAAIYFKKEEGGDEKV